MDRARTEPEGAPLNADPAAQVRLLDVQALDAALDRLAHRRATLPELARIGELNASLASLRDELVMAQTEDGDLAREQRKAEADVDQVRERASRDQTRLDAGSVASPKELESLQSEIASLAKRRNDLEDVVLDVMERRESAQSRAAELAQSQSGAEAELASATQARDATFAEIDAEAAGDTASRADVVGEIPADLLALYEKVRAQSGGVGAAPLFRGRCEGCHLSLNPGDLAHLRDTPADVVVRCEECRRILVRTPESGL